jgi:hypothetical protein
VLTYASHPGGEWIFDVDGKQLHVFRYPTSGVYGETQSMESPGVLAITSLPGVVVDLSSLQR